MKAKEIQVGGFYTARIGGNFVTVRVDAIEDVAYPAGRSRGYTAYHVTNLKTGRKTTFRSAMKFRAKAKPIEPKDALNGPGHRAAAKEANRLVGTATELEDLEGNRDIVEGKKDSDPTSEAASSPPLTLSKDTTNSPAPVAASAPPSSPAAVVVPRVGLLGKRRGAATTSPETTTAKSPPSPTSEPMTAKPCEPTKTTATVSNGEQTNSDGVEEGSRNITPSWRPKPVQLSLFHGQEEKAEQFFDTMNRRAEAALKAEGFKKVAQVHDSSVWDYSIPPGETPAETSKRSIMSRLQQAVVASESTTDTAPHLIVEARAGTGKTTTLVEGLKFVLGGSSSMVPSPQQDAIWKEMAKSAGHVKTACFVAFNKAIAEELKRRVPKGCDAMTMHSMGFKAVTKAFGRQEPSEYTVTDLIADMLFKDPRELRREKPILLRATGELVSLCKMNLSNLEADCPGTVGVCTHPHGACREWDELLSDLASHYEVELEDEDSGRSYRREVFDLVPRVLEECKRPRGRIAFDDMIWLPVIHDLPMFKYDMLLVDELQDLNRCQQAMAKKAGKRLVGCGDTSQAIYGFAGADAKSMSRMYEELFDTDRGCEKLPLTVTRRCGKRIVEEAKRIVPDFDAFETNPEGIVREDVYPIDQHGRSRPEPHYTVSVQDGDMVVCRVNAPLVGQCFRFLKMGRKANIQGRNIGDGLVSSVKKLWKTDDKSFIYNLDNWLHGERAKENAKRNPDENRLIALEDRHACLMTFLDNLETTVVEAPQEDYEGESYGTVAERVSPTKEQLIAKIESVFTDDKTVPGIRLSSIHKAKGLEADRVFFLLPKGGECPHPMAKSAWQREQELNLRYVAITRAKTELVFVY